LIAITLGKMSLRSTLLLATAVLATADRSTVIIPDGAIAGVRTEHYRSFHGIPFAKKPLRTLRFAPPEKNAPWKPDTLQATKYRHNCLQIGGFDPAQPRDTVDEDCLYLNVFTPPNANATSKMPVLFWLHGGGFMGGGETRAG
jgi:para-nitrobenzyl esterase